MVWDVMGWVNTLFWDGVWGGGGGGGGGGVENGGGAFFAFL